MIRFALVLVCVFTCHVHIPRTDTSMVELMINLIMLCEEHCKAKTEANCYSMYKIISNSVLCYKDK